MKVIYCKLQKNANSTSPRLRHPSPVRRGAGGEVNLNCKTGQQTKKKSQYWIQILRKENDEN